MKNSFTRKHLISVVACALALGFAAGAAQAQNTRAPIDDRQVWVDTSKQVWMNGFGECWHSAFGPPPGYGPCNPAPIAQYVAPPPPAPAPYVAPAVVAPVQYVAPAPAPVVVPAPLPRKKDRN